LQEPDVRNRAGQFDMAHALATHLGHCDFDAALFANDAAMLQAFVFATKTFVVFDGSEDLGAEQAITLGLERTVVDGFRLAYFAVRLLPLFFSRLDADRDGIDLFFSRALLE